MRKKNLCVSWSTGGALRTVSLSLSRWCVIGCAKVRVKARVKVKDQPEGTQG